MASKDHREDSGYPQVDDYVSRVAARHLRNRGMRIVVSARFPDDFGEEPRNSAPRIFLTPITSFTVPFARHTFGTKAKQKADKEDISLHMMEAHEVRFTVHAPGERGLELLSVSDFGKCLQLGKERGTTWVEPARIAAKDTLSVAQQPFFVVDWEKADDSGRTLWCVTLDGKPGADRPFDIYDVSFRAKKV